MNVDLNRRARIEFKQVSQNATYGTEQITWALKAVVWCNVQDVLPSRSEAIKNGIAIGTKQARFRIRYRTDLNSSMRVVLDGVVYQIISDFAEINGKRFIEAMIERYTTS